MLQSSALHGHFVEFYIGGERGAAAYSAVEHIALLSIISEVPDALNAGESSPQWVAVYNRMVKEYYNSGNVQQSSTLHGHFVEFYIALKLGTRNLSLNDRMKKCPSVYEKGNVAVDEYLAALTQLIL